MSSSPPPSPSSPRVTASPPPSPPSVTASPPPSPPVETGFPWSTTPPPRFPVNLEQLPRDAPIPIYLDLDPDRDDPDHQLLARYLRAQSSALDRLRTSIVGPGTDLDPASAHALYIRDPTFMRWTPQQASDAARITRCMDNLGMLIAIIAERQRIVRKLGELETAMRQLNLEVFGPRA